MYEQVFHDMDRLRRWSGDWLEFLCLPRHETPSSSILDAVGARLREYRRSDGGPALLIVPAPIKRHYIWDLSSETSVVAQALASGFRVYLVEWMEAPPHFGLSEYVAILEDCVARIRLEIERPVHLATHSLGGIVSVAYAALHPEDVATLALVESPLDFANQHAFRSMFDVAPSGRQIAERFGSVPGSFLSTVAVMACPDEFELERYADWAGCGLDSQKRWVHLQVERWALDELPLPGALYTEIVDELYRSNALMQAELLVMGRRIGPGQLRLPLLSVFDPECRVVPAESIVAFHDAAASADKILLPYSHEPGVGLRHVGPLVGHHAHETLWPSIFAWIGQRERRPS